MRSVACLEAFSAKSARKRDDHSFSKFTGVYVHSIREIQTLSKRRKTNVS